MAIPVVHQFAYRAQKQFGLSTSAPTYEPVADFQAPEATVRNYTYSGDGRYLAYALPTCVRILDAESAVVLHELSLPNIMELNFSPKATFLSTWERPIKLEDGVQHKNLRIFSVATGEQLTAFTQKGQDSWDMQYTHSEQYALRLVNAEVHIFEPANWARGIVDKAKIDNCTTISVSPGKNPSVAVFTAEKSGMPASIKIFSVPNINAPPTCAKSTFKADRCSMKWNNLGTQVLVLTQTDVDTANKNYYGETGLYLLSAAGNFDARVGLDKEGPIHDYTWNPNSKEFGVIYGFMPSKAVIFDQRLRSVHDFGANPRNFISFNPQGRLIALAGFGNLAGKVDVHDRQSLKLVCTIDAPNTSFFDWSGCGTYILTATLSPRLRVDNGIKLWHCAGTLVHQQLIEELYQTSWRPRTIGGPFPPAIPPPPTPSPIILGLAAGTTGSGATSPSPKPAGAYRPPGARGLATPAIYKREDEGGAPHISGASTPYGRASPAPRENGYHHPNGRGRGGARVVPGAPPPRENGEEKTGQGKKKKKGKREEVPSIEMPVPVLAVETALDAETPATENPLSPDGALDPVQKKIRNLSKKLKAIEELKEKHARGEKLEATQVKKMDGEADIRVQLQELQSQNGTGM